MKILDNIIENNGKIELLLEDINELDSLSLEMVENSDIDNILPMSLLKDNDNDFLIYNLQGFYKLDKNDINPDNFTLLIRSLLDLEEVIEDYYLLKDNILLTHEYIYMKDNKPYFIYLPFLNIDNRFDLDKFSKYLILEGNFSSEDKSFLLKILDLLDEGINNDSFNRYFNESSQVEEEQALYEEEDIMEILEDKKSLDTDSKKKHSNIIKDVLNKFLHRKVSIEDVSPSRIEELKTNNQIELKKYFRIGSDKEASDLYIKSSEVSLFHCLISISDDYVYIEDNNTKTGTYINGKKILPKVKNVLKVGDKISIGSKEFTYEIK